MHPCRLILCEKNGQWASMLRAELRDAPPMIAETRSFVGCLSELGQSPASLAAVEVTTTNCEPALDFLIQNRERFPEAVFVAFVDHESSGAELLLREAGAIDVIRSVLEIPRLARLARRKYGRTPHPQVSLRDWASERMPWPAYATSNRQ
jgi:hypothetical protein